MLLELCYFPFVHLAITTSVIDCSDGIKHYEGALRTQVGGESYGASLAGGWGDPVRHSYKSLIVVGCIRNGPKLDESGLAPTLDLGAENLTPETVRPE